MCLHVGHETWYYPRNIKVLSCNIQTLQAYSASTLRDQSQNTFLGMTEFPTAMSHTHWIEEMTWDQTNPVGWAQVNRKRIPLPLNMILLNGWDLNYSSLTLDLFKLATWWAVAWSPPFRRTELDDLVAYHRPVAVPRWGGASCPFPKIWKGERVWFCPNKISGQIKWKTASYY